MHCRRVSGRAHDRGSATRPLRRECRQPGDAAPTRRIRTHVLVPIAFADGFETTARVFTFDGLADGREHLALGLGDRAAARAGRVRRGADAHPAAQRVPDRRRLRQPALRLRCAAARVGRAPRRERRVPALPAAGGARHRPLPQARRLRAPGRRARHLRGERRAGLRRGRAGLHRGGPDARRRSVSAGSPCSATTPTRPSSCGRSASRWRGGCPRASTSPRRTPTTWRPRCDAPPTPSTCPPTGGEPEAPGGVEGAEPRAYGRVRPGRTDRAP